MDFRGAITSIEEKIGLLQQARVCLIEAEESERQRLLLERELVMVNAGGPAGNAEQTLTKRATSQQKRRAREREAMASQAPGSDVTPAEPRPEQTIPAARKTPPTSPLGGDFPAQPVVVPPRTLDPASTHKGLVLARKESVPAGEGSLDALVRDLGLRQILTASASSEL